MKVQRIWIGENVFNFILIGDDYRPIDYITQYMKYLYSIGKTMNGLWTFKIFCVPFMLQLNGNIMP